MRHAAVKEGDLPVGFSATKARKQDRDTGIAMPTSGEPVQATKRRMLPRSSDDDKQRAKHVESYWNYLVAASEARARHKREED